MDSATIKALGLILIVFLALAIKTGPGAAQAVGGPMEPIKVGVTLREYWVEAISREEALRRLAKRRLNPELRKRIEERIPRETKHYLTFHDKTFREYADFGEGFTSLLLTLPMEEKDSVFTVIVPIRGSERRDDGRIRQLSGIEFDEFTVSGPTLIENGQARETFRFSREPLELQVDVSFVADGRMRHPGGSTCCNACEWVHSVLDIHSADWLCCLGCC